MLDGKMVTTSSNQDRVKGALVAINKASEVVVAGEHQGIDG
jgi:hypothetical protein